MCNLTDYSLNDLNDVFQFWFSDMKMYKISKNKKTNF